MDKTMFQLRLFVHQRMYTAAEEIIEQFEKTIMLAVSEAEGGWSKKGLKGCSLTSSTIEPAGGVDASVLQENQDSSLTEQSNFSLDPEVPGPSQPCADLDNNGWNVVETDFVKSEMKEEQEDFMEKIQTLKVVVALRDQKQGEKMNDAGEAADFKNDEAEVADVDRSVKRQPDRHFCHLCGKSFLYTGALVRHNTVKHENKTDCGICGLKRQTTKKLIAHLKGFHSTSNFCDICGRIYSHKNGLKTHKIKHTGNKDFVCQECGKSFFLRAHLVVHVRTHSGDKPYKCNMCGKTFTQSQNLLAHKRGHLGEKPYCCGFCDKRFVTSSSLNSHVRFHTGEKPYSCNICGRTFRASGQMTRHRRTHLSKRP
uniref:C2H2-type domain-containing protein n=2 Tax=Iconisemion striatum TaxID=60296 RepID=A0A1A7XCA4_9TELE